MAPGKGPAEGTAGDHSIYACLQLQATAAKMAPPGRNPAENRYKKTRRSGFFLVNGAGDQAAGTTLTKVRLFLPLTRNSTLPSVLA